MHYQQIIYIMLTLAGAAAHVEERSHKGVIDIVAETKTHIYIVETKLDKTADEAITQIEKNDYADDSRPITKIGLNFDSEKRNINSWEVIGNSVAHHISTRNSVEKVIEESHSSITLPNH